MVSIVLGTKDIVMKMFVKILILVELKSSTVSNISDGYSDIEKNKAEGRIYNTGKKGGCNLTKSSLRRCLSLFGWL